MRIKMKSIMAGPRGVFDAGSIVDLPKSEATALISGGYATVVDDTLHASEAAAATRAIAEAAAIEHDEEETAAMPTAGKRRRAN